MTGGGRPIVVILGAGINGCSVARELVLNGVGVWIVEANDVAFGATSRSSRLIHGGLRYLEYADFHLVRESLAERARLCRLAPHLVEPLRLYIPVAQRAGGLLQSAGRFLGVARTPTLNWLAQLLQRPSERGLWTIEIGLALYDRFAADPNTPPHSVHDVSEPDMPQVDSRRFHWLCGYNDAQMRFPERYCVALLEDSRQAARQTKVDFRVETYARAEFDDGSVRVTRASGEVLECSPSIVINATGAWGDLTLGELRVRARRLLGGTKGSHFITHQAVLKKAIGRAGVYAEAADGRLIFVLPFGEGVLVGTTDERFDENPEQAVASKEELDYLLSTVNELFPDVRISKSDVLLTYSGVRPLPYVETASENSISRDHSIAVQSYGDITVLTLVGGKLTTSRAFGELVADDVLTRLDIHRSAMTTGRVVPGGEGLPVEPEARERRRIDLASRFHLTVEQIRAMEALCGSQVEEILEAQRADADSERGQNVCGTSLPRTFVRWVIEHEWVSKIEDLVERRLMLLYDPALSSRTLDELAGLLIESGRLDPNRRTAAIETARGRLRALYARTLAD